MSSGFPWAIAWVPWYHNVLMSGELLSFTQSSIVDLLFEIRRNSLSMLELWVLRLVDKDDSDDINTAQRIALKPEFKWFMSAEFRELRGLGGNEPQIVPVWPEDETEKERIPLSSKDSLLIEKEAAFWDIYDQLEEEQRNGSNHMEIDKTTVSGQELKQRLVSSGRFYTSDAHMMIVEMVSKGELEQVSYDTYARVYNKIEMNEELC